ncbi:MAG: HAD family hydrolase [Candidatus Omnitrophota bacterium]|nr:HAD family hydrolase [Candidatus Omnitrophota bacterium]
MSRVVFVDRDGVINVDLIGDYVKSWDEFRFEEGAMDAMKILTDAHYDIVVVSNQAGIGDGVFEEEALWDVHQKMLAEFEKHKVKIKSSFYCLHGKNAGCKCRKPETGLFERAAREIDFNPSETFFIGDKATDIEAGKRFGLKTIFVRTGHGAAEEPKLQGDLVPDHIVNNLAEAAELLRR